MHGIVSFLTNTWADDTRAPLGDLCLPPAGHTSCSRQALRNALAGTQFRHRRRQTFAITVAAGRQSGRKLRNAAINRGCSRLWFPVPSPRGPTPRPQLPKTEGSPDARQVRGNRQQCLRSAHLTRVGQLVRDHDGRQSSSPATRDSRRESA